MSFTRWGYDFDGLSSNAETLIAKAGVYVIWCFKGNLWAVLDVGESENVVDRINNHDRKDCWLKNCQGITRYSATYIFSQQKRLDLENKIRSQERVACGER